MGRERDHLAYENTDEARPDRGEADDAPRNAQADATRPPRRRDDVDRPETANAKRRTRSSTGTSRP